jgi:hypothetical protein
MNITLSITYHDPAGKLYPQIERTLPALLDIFSGIAVRGSRQANEKSLALFAAMGAKVKVDSAPSQNSGGQIGRARREAVDLALGFEAPFNFHCDGDRVLHWAEIYPDELIKIVTKIPKHDFTLFGRTPRAWATHPRIQRDTEAIVNHIFHLKTGWEWDVMIGARGMSRQAAQAIVTGCLDNEISVDVTWPLFLRSYGNFSLTYIPTEGLEFETQNRYQSEVNAAGSQTAWLDGLDADIDKWLHRVDYIRLDLEAMRPYFEAPDTP